MNALQNQMQEELSLYEICKEVITVSRNELYLGMRFLDRALFALESLPDPATSSWGCDGRSFHFSPTYLLQMYRADPVQINRGIFHQVLHCLFGHIWSRPAVQAGKRMAGHQKSQIEESSELQMEGQLEPQIEGHRKPQIKGSSEPQMEGQLEPQIEGHQEPQMEEYPQSRTEGHLEPKIEEPSELLLEAADLARWADWDLACDITAEYLMDGMTLRCLRAAPSAFRREWYRRLEQDLSVVTAQKVYQTLLPMDPSDPLYRRLTAEFRRDDHQFWRQAPEHPNQMQNQQNWKDLREKMQSEIELFSREASQEAGSVLQALQVEMRERYDYREFLRRFSVLKEEVQVDIDSFDYIFYHYGMELYGNMPLIEPLETRELQKIEDFVIVIDTSMSCRGELVKTFLEQTYEILSQASQTSRRIRIRILQCDERVQEDREIKGIEELHRYMEHLTIKGGGGTDFRPAFQYVQELMARSAFMKLKGLLYFTDGYGTYPVKPPPYDVAFVFLEDHYRDVDVPPWAMKLILTEDEIQYEH